MLVLRYVCMYSDIPTAVVAKEALEGHSIYDGGYCKLHLSYSRHIDLNVKVTVIIVKYNCFIFHVILNSAI